MLAALKMGVGSATVWTIATAVGDLAMDVVAIGGAVGVIVGGGTWLWKRMLVPAAKGFQRTHDAVEALEDLGAFMQEQRDGVRDARVSASAAAASAHALEGRMDLLERHVGLHAAEEAVTVRALMAQAEQQQRRSA